MIRCDLNEPGMLYAGTESGLYISHDDGTSWQSFQLNLPIVPVTDLAVKENNLVVATQGRSLWVIDDLSPLYQLSSSKDKDFYLYQPKDSYRMRGGQAKDLKTAGSNHPAGVMVYFNVPEVDDSIETSISFYNSADELIETYSTKNEKENKLELEEGANLFLWDMRYPDAEKFDGMIFWAGSLQGPQALPGQYKVELKQGSNTQQQSFTILKDPRIESSDEDLAAQFDFVKGVNAKVTEAHQSIKKIREVRQQMNQVKPILKENDQAEELLDRVKEIEEKLLKIEKTLYQTQNESRQDPLNFPIRLTNKLAYLNSINRGGDYAPTKQQQSVREDLEGKINSELADFKSVLTSDLPAFNEAYRNLSLDVIQLEDNKKTDG